MDLDDSTPKKSAGFVIGSSLETLSVGELEALVATLKSEQARVEAEIGRKQAQASAAESLFRSK